jgi:hypothetical protein
MECLDRIVAVSLEPFVSSLQTGFDIVHGRPLQHQRLLAVRLDNLNAEHVAGSDAERASDKYRQHDLSLGADPGGQPPASWHMHRRKIGGLTHSGQSREA